MISRTLEIELKHHLAMEGELIAEGLLVPPASVKPEPAKKMSGILVKTDWDLKLQKRNVPIVVKRRVPSEFEITNIRRRFW